MDEAFQQSFGGIVVEPAHRRLVIDGEPAKIGARAFDLLMALIERRDRVVSKDELLDLVWPNVTVEEGNLQVQIATLRRLLGAEAITTIPGRGYRFVAPGQVRQTPDELPAPAAEPRDGAGQVSAPGWRGRFAGIGDGGAPQRRRSSPSPLRAPGAGLSAPRACSLPANRASLRCPSSM